MAPKARIILSRVNDVTVATIEDSSMIDPQHIEELRATLNDLIDQQDRRKLVLNMSKVKHMSSAALGVLIPLQEKYSKAKGQLVLVGVNDSIMKLFTLTKLNKLLKIANTENEAVTAMGG